jgi:hypothetical protein
MPFCFVLKSCSAKENSKAVAFSLKVVACFGALENTQSPPLRGPDGAWWNASR